MNSYVPHFRPTSAKEEALRRWSPNQRHTAMITAIRRISSVPARAITQQPRFVTNPTYWRDRLTALHQGVCHLCGGAGEVTVPGIFGEYEGTEPCWVCQRSQPTSDQPVDDTPF